MSRTPAEGPIERPATLPAVRPSGPALPPSYLDNMHEGVVVATRSQRLHHNLRMAELLGFTPEEYSGVSLMSRVHPDDLAVVTRELGAVFRGKHSVSDFECRLIDKRGRTKWVRCKSSLIDWSGQKAAITFVEDMTARMQAEEAAKESIEIIDTIFKSVREPFWLSRLDDGQIVKLNHTFEDTFGYNRDEVIGRTPLELGLWLDTAEREQMAQQLGTDGLVRDLPVSCRRKTGETFPALLSATLSKMGGIKYLVSFIREETERTRAQAALEQSEARYRLLADNIVDVIWLADPDTLCSTYVSPSCRLLDGYEPEELLGAPICGRVAPHAREAREQVMRSLVEEFSRRSELFLDDEAEVEIVRKDGSAGWVEVRVRVFRDPSSGRVALLGLTRDKSKQRAAEEALGEKQRQLDRFFSLEVGLLSVEDMDGRLLLISSGWETALGYSKEEILARATEDFVHADDRRSRQEAMGRLRAGKDVVEYVSRLRAKDGSYRTIAWRCARDGDLVYCAARDVTELIAAQERLRQSQKMEAIGQLAGGIAHDFNNLLTAILGYTDLLLASSEGRGEDLRLDLLEIKGAAKRAADLTQQILAFSRKQALRPEVICINDVLSELKPLLERLLGEAVVLEVETADDLGRCEIDPGQFTQVVINLIVNARDAMPQGGFLILQTANAEVGKQSTSSALADLGPGSYVVLKCTDTGLGMDEETASRIFEPFFTTKAAGQGTGLGLSTVHGIVHQSGGTVVVESHAGKGTAFTIYLPRIAGAVPQFSAADEASRPRAGQGTVLVAEDEEAVGALAARILAAHGYAVLTATDSTQALALLSDPGQDIDLLLTDMVLPGGMHGGELADAARSMRADLNVAYMSGYSRDSTIHGGRLDEKVRFLQKPFTANGLVAVVEEALAERSRTAEGRPQGRTGKEKKP